jgi:hypothetical protein
MSFSVPKKKAISKASKKEVPIVIDLYFEKEVGFYKLEFAGKKTHQAGNSFKHMFDYLWN